MGDDRSSPLPLPPPAARRLWVHSSSPGEKGTGSVWWMTGPQNPPFLALASRAARASRATKTFHMESERCLRLILSL